MPGPFQDPKNTHAVEVKNSPDGKFYVEFFRRNGTPAAWKALIYGWSQRNREAVYEMVKTLVQNIAAAVTVVRAEGDMVIPGDGVKLVCNIFRQKSKEVEVLGLRPGAPMPYVFNICDQDGLPLFLSSRNYESVLEVEQDFKALQVAVENATIGGLIQAMGVQDK